MFQMFDVSIMMGVLRCSRAFWGIHFKDNNIDVQMLPIDGYKKLETEKVGCFSWHVFCSASKRVDGNCKSGASMKEPKRTASTVATANSFCAFSDGYLFKTKISHKTESSKFISFTVEISTWKSDKSIFQHKYMIRIDIYLSRMKFLPSWGPYQDVHPDRKWCCMSGLGLVSFSKNYSESKWIY